MMRQDWLFLRRCASTLADKIVNELIPNAIQQIFDAFSSLESAMNGNTVTLALSVSCIDGPGKNLAYASYSYINGGGRHFSMWRRAHN